MAAVAAGRYIRFPEDAASHKWAPAAMARRDRLTILSRNVPHFAPLGVKVPDPFAAFPPG